MYMYMCFAILRFPLEEGLDFKCTTVLVCAVVHLWPLSN